jgi:hypothetical protein
MWCDTFDADLLKVVPGAAEALGEAAQISLTTRSHVTGGKINCPSAWNTHDGLMSFFWTTLEYQPDASYYTEHPIVECTFLEAVRDEWVHSAVVNVNGQIVWRPPVRLMERLMFDLRGWTVLADDAREYNRQRVRESLRKAARRIQHAILPAGARTAGPGCICGPDSTGEYIDVNPGCLVHGYPF